MDHGPGFPVSLTHCGQGAISFCIQLLSAMGGSAAPLTFRRHVMYFHTMDPSARLALIAGLFSSSFVLNVPMGMLRSRTRKLSALWFICVHATIPVIYFGRMFSGLDTLYVPIFIVAAVMGQVMGGRMGL